jgi:hypothetical protein
MGLIATPACLCPFTHDAVDLQRQPDHVINMIRRRLCNILWQSVAGKDVGAGCGRLSARWHCHVIRWVHPHRLDVTFREDACRVRKDSAARNLSLVRKISLAMLRLDTAYPKSSLGQRRKRTSRKPLYREELIGLRPRSQTSNKTQKK